MSPFAAWTLTQEARALQTRLGRVRPFALLEPMVAAAALLPRAQSAIEEYLVDGRRGLRGQVQRFTDWVRGPGRSASNADAQRRFSLLRLRFNAVLTQFDLFSDVITQRSEHETGVWLSGLDVASADALTLPASPVPVPPVICYLDRGGGAAIRRARTRLPGGGDEPGGDHPRAARADGRQRHRVVALPRGRPPGRRAARHLGDRCGRSCAACSAAGATMPRCGSTCERWISEIVADFFAVGAGRHRLDAGADRRRQPAAGVRVPPQPRRPAPGALDSREAQLRDRRGAAPASAMAATRRSPGSRSIPIAELDAERRGFFERLVATIPAFVSLLVNHRPAALRGRSLARSAGSRRSAAGATEGAVPGLVAPSRAPLRRPGVARVRRHRPGARRRLMTPEDEAVLSASCSATGRCAARSTPRSRAQPRLPLAGPRRVDRCGGTGDVERWCSGNDSRQSIKEIDMETHDRADKLDKTNAAASSSPLPTTGIL